jgi:hypothetical protein
MVNTKRERHITAQFGEQSRLPRVSHKPEARIVLLVTPHQHRDWYDLKKEGRMGLYGERISVGRLLHGRVIT